MWSIRYTLSADGNHPKCLSLHVVSCGHPISTNVVQRLQFPGWVWGLFFNTYTINKQLSVGLWQWRPRACQRKLYPGAIYFLHSLPGWVQLDVGNWGPNRKHPAQSSFLSTTPLCLWGCYCYKWKPERLALSSMSMKAGHFHWHPPVQAYFPPCLCCAKRIFCAVSGNATSGLWCGRSAACLGGNMNSCNLRRVLSNQEAQP